MITIFTPTYNRAHLLPRLFESLVTQKNKNFKWLVVDDGSTDNTKELIDQFSTEADFKITYIFQSNQGKHVAINTALENIDTTYFLTIDSDDKMVENGINLIYKKIDLIDEDDTLAAIASPIYVVNHPNLDKYKPLAKDNLIYNSFGSGKGYEKNLLGENSYIFKTKIAKQYPYPVFEGEKFLKESIVFKRISCFYNFLYIKDTVVVAEYQEDGLSSDFIQLLKNNPKGAAISFEELMNYTQIPFKKRIHYALVYWDFETLSGETSFFKRLRKIKSNRLKIAFILKKYFL
ncbi:glycosyltransferase family A protein [Weeksella sp. HMSC059D05]|uniref:glycosyltransferase family A protein n=1 Tax=Weeksella sp. HMSC059D05 TaxID=1715139 RepID=UPI0008A2D42D|nr:glycosyltransferase family 2 protein [Weeksella sp. HMSC059D05]OFM81823.1 hypothetical protein HMPREF2660_05580 [Weeksella sp. HMSC059D05]